MWFLFHFGNAMDIPIVIFPSPEQSVYAANRLLPAFDIAYQTISERVQSGKYANFTISWVYYSTGCSHNERLSVGMAAERYFFENAAAFFGPTCSNNLLSVADFASFYNITVLSGSASSHDLDDKERFPTLTQTVYKPTAMVNFVNELFKEFEWTSCAMIRGGSDVFNLAGEAFEEIMQRAGRSVFIIELNDTNNDYVHTLQQTREDYRSKYSLLCYTIVIIVILFRSHYFCRFLWFIINCELVKCFFFSLYFVCLPELPCFYSWYNFMVFLRLFCL